MCPVASRRMCVRPQQGVFKFFFSGRDNDFVMLARLCLLSPGAWPDLREHQENEWVRPKLSLSQAQIRIHAKGPVDGARPEP